MNINSKCYRCGWEFSIETDEAMPAEHVPHICATCASVINLVVHEPVPPAELLGMTANLHDGHVYHMGGRFFVFNELPFGEQGDGWMSLIGNNGADVRTKGEIIYYHRDLDGDTWTAQVQLYDDAAPQNVSVHAETKDFAHVAVSVHEFKQRSAASWAEFAKANTGRDVLVGYAAPDVLAECTARAEYDKHVDATAASLLADVNIF